jgi:predicted sulfurtransferase
VICGRCHWLADRSSLRYFTVENLGRVLREVWLELRHVAVVCTANSHLRLCESHSPFGTMSLSTVANQDNSDPVNYTCTCAAQTEGGHVLLFYRYFDNTPALPSEHASNSQDPHALAEYHRRLACDLEIGGKFRVATEGYNITLGGTKSATEKYIQACCTHWSFAGIDLSTPSARDAYFKPTPGCACAFGGKAFVRVTAEITPLGVTNYSPSSWSNVISLPPAEFHDLLKKGDIPLIDVRNHYESRVGYFVTGNGTVAVRPAVRRFSQWPGYVVRHVLGNDAYKKPQGIATYCTGGIRCEKGARWMQEALLKDGGREDAPVYTLHGGIVAYQAWMQEEVDARRKIPEDSFFKGTNYVFDARGAIGAQQAVSACHGCKKPEDRLDKCEMPGCHLVLVVCKPCEQQGGIVCCEDCRRIESEQQAPTRSRRMCQCENDRERSIWGEGGASLGKGKRRQKTSAW